MICAPSDAVSGTSSASGRPAAAGVVWTVSGKYISDRCATINDRRQADIEAKRDDGEPAEHGHCARSRSRARLSGPRSGCEGACGGEQPRNEAAGVCSAPGLIGSPACPVIVAFGAGPGGDHACRRLYWHGRVAEPKWRSCMLTKVCSVQKINRPAIASRPVEFEVRR